MITWMQRHKKYLIVTIWISTIAFIGAGFVGWGQYSYGEKATAVAQVGDIKVSRADLQKEYSKIYAQYNQMFQGDFDEAKAKQFGLQRQALQQLTQQALLLNLAKDFDLTISDAELLAKLTTQKFFFKDGKFDKEVYKQILSRNRLTMKEYESDLKKQLLLEKVIRYLPVKENANERKILHTLVDIADNISYKVLTKDMLKVKLSDKLLKKFWEPIKGNYMSDVVYQVKYIQQKNLSLNYDDNKIKEYYEANKLHFKDSDGKILPLKKAKQQIIAELNEKSTKDKALRNYIAFKKGKLAKEITIKDANISRSHNNFNDEVLTKISSKTLTSPFLKPIKVKDHFYIFEIVTTLPAKIKTFEEVKGEIIPLYKEEMTKRALLKYATKAVTNFKGEETGFIHVDYDKKIGTLSKEESSEFLNKLFNTQVKRDFIELSDGKIVLYNIMEQKLLQNKVDTNNSLLGLKTRLFGDGMMKKLQNRYHTEIFIKGL